MVAICLPQPADFLGGRCAQDETAIDKFTPMSSVYAVLLRLAHVAARPRSACRRFMDSVVRQHRANSALSPPPRLFDDGQNFI